MGLFSSNLSGISGKKLWSFQWKEGGFNSVMAESKQEAIRLATAMGRPVPGGMKVTLTPDPATFRTGVQNLIKLERSYGPFD